MIKLLSFDANVQPNQFYFKNLETTWMNIMVKILDDKGKRQRTTVHQHVTQKVVVQNDLLNRLPNNINYFTTACKRELYFIKGSVVIFSIRVKHQ